MSLDQRRWLAMKLLDDRLSDDEAYGIVAFHPAIKDTRDAARADRSLAELTGEVEALAEDAFNEGWRSREARPSPMLNSRTEMRREWLDSNARDAVLAKLGATS